MAHEGDGCRKRSGCLRAHGAEHPAASLSRAVGFVGLGCECEELQIY